jgi:hypothetical protein
VTNNLGLRFGRVIGKDGANFVAGRIELQANRPPDLAGDVTRIRARPAMNVVVAAGAGGMIEGGKRQNRGRR